MVEFPPASGRGNMLDIRVMLKHGGSWKSMATQTSDPSRLVLVNRALFLEWLTVGWNLVEGGIGLAAAVAARSTVLLGFGVDSFIESLSGAAMIWRFNVERGGAHPGKVELVEALARRLVAGSLAALAIYIAFDAVMTLWTNGRPRPSIVGIVLTLVSIGAMIWLARAKREVAAGLQSRALETDAFQTTACWWLSVVTLAGTGLNALLGWWWADPAGALCMTWFLVREAVEAWSGDACRCRG